MKNKQTVYEPSNNRIHTKLDEILHLFAIFILKKTRSRNEINFQILKTKEAIADLFEEKGLEVIGDEMSIDLAFDDRDKDKIEASNFVRIMQREKLKQFKGEL